MIYLLYSQLFVRLANKLIRYTVTNSRIVEDNAQEGCEEMHAFECVV